MSALATDLLPPAPLTAFLDEHALGSGDVRVRRVGDGASNLTYLVERGGRRMIVRRPPPPPLPPSAHDMQREARIQSALAGRGVPVPRILAVCDDLRVLGVPFYVMEEVEGVVITDVLPPGLDAPEERHGLGLAVIDSLAALHAVDWRDAGLDGLGRPTGYLDRQLRRWSGLWEHNATRPLPEFDTLARRLRETMPAEQPPVLVHGDFRLGNLLVAPDAPARVLAVLDWEMATVGDPLADLGYAIVSWSSPGVEDHPLLLSPATAQPGFASREELVGRYAGLTGRGVEALDWYQALALWKAAVFCEAIYARYLRGERDDPFAASLEAGVPRLVDAGMELAR